VFGPVVCVYTCDDLDEAIARANALPVAFQAAAFTRDHATAMRAYARLDASAVMLNEHTAFRVDWMPFAGLRESGLGVGGTPTLSGTCRSRRCSLELCHENPCRGEASRQDATT
jgi:acyl-CoA reductase-like NAD-dependent aldehyde dehydrogenase